MPAKLGYKGPLKMKNYLPRYINNKHNAVNTVVWTTVWAWLFIIVYQPFNSLSWVSAEHGINELRYVAVASLVVLIGMIVLAASRTIMYQYAKRYEVSYLDFGIWVALEIAIMSAFYAFAPIVTGLTDGYAFITLWGEALKYTAAILLIPYTILTLLFICLEQRQELIRAGIREGNLRQNREEPGMYNFYDEKGELKLSIRPDTLYYIESADNYVLIHYTNAGKMQHFLLRNSMKSVEAMFRDKNLIRCHRSYIVNYSLVKVLKRAETGLVLDFDKEKVPNIPVSKTYSQKVMERLTIDAE